MNLSVLDYDSLEVGDCSDAEATLKLADVVDLVIREYCEGGDVGPYDSGAWDMWMIGNVAASHEIAELDPGAHCTIDLELLVRFAAASLPANTVIRPDRQRGPGRVR